MLTKAFVSVSLLCSVTGTQAATWAFDPDGPLGPGGPIPVSQGIDFSGPSYIRSSAPVPLQLPTFEEVGALLAQGADGANDGLGHPAGEREVTAVFRVTGLIVPRPLGGADLGYTGGTVSVYSDDTPDFGGPSSLIGGANGVLIGEFAVSGGVGTVLPDFSGTQTLELVPTLLAPGYWFGPDGTTDLAALPSSQGRVTALVDVEFTRDFAPDVNVISQLVASIPGSAFTNCLFGETAGAIPGSPCIGIDGAMSVAFINPGRMQVLVVPEANTLSMFVCGFLMLMVVLNGRKPGLPSCCRDATAEASAMLSRP